LEEDHPISSLLKRNPVLAEPTQLNSIEQEGIKKELSEENEEPIKEIEEKLVKEGKDLNQENKTKNEMSNGGGTEAVNPNKSTTEIESNGEDGFEPVLNQQINQRQLVVTTSTTLQARSCRIEGPYTKFGEDDITLQHAGRWSEGIQGIG
jgi:hypothetical protein